MRLERHQVWVYLAAILVGLGLGAALPQAGPTLELVVWPVLAALLFVTFTQIPLTHLAVAFRDLRFISAVLVGNFLVLPAVVRVLLELAPEEPAVRYGVLLVLLVPCTDWFISFVHLAGCDTRRALVVTPLNLLAQFAMLPVYLWLFTGAQFAQAISAERAVTVFASLIALPLVAAWATQRYAQRTRMPAVTLARFAAAPVPLVALVVFLIAASQVTTVTGSLHLLPRLTLVYGAFLTAAAGLGWVIATWFGLEPAGSRTLIFSLGTRNSFVVLPIALALPDGWQVAVVVVVFQSLVELLGMAAYLWAVPRWLAPPAPA